MQIGRQAPKIMAIGWRRQRAAMISGYAIAIPDFAVYGQDVAPVARRV
jgi:hypothetical protein